MYHLVYTFFFQCLNWSFSSSYEGRHTETIIQMSSGSQEIPIYETAFHPNCHHGLLYFLWFARYNLFPPNPICACTMHGTNGLSYVRMKCFTLGFSFLMLAIFSHVHWHLSQSDSYLSFSTTNKLMLVYLKVVLQCQNTIYSMTGDSCYYSTTIMHEHWQSFRKSASIWRRKLNFQPFQKMVQSYQMV